MLEVLGVPEHVHAFERACVWLGLAGLVACAVTCVILFVARVVDKFSRRIRVTEIWIYPIKSAGGVRVESARVDRAGLRWDREFAVASRCGAILSQKAHPRLAAIAPTLEIGRAGELAALTLTSATSPALRVDVNGATEAVSTTWAGNSEPLAAIAFPVADAWLEDHLDVKGARLVRLAGRRLLRTTRLAPVALDARDGCRFSDGAPLSLLGEASVRDLGRKVPDRALTPARFRPNLVFAGARAYAESGWTRLRVGRVPVRSLMDCYRCSMVAVVQAAESGDRAGEIRVWDPKSGDCRKVLKKHSKWITALAWCPAHLEATGCETLASASKDASVKLWNVRTGAMLASLTGHTDSVEARVPLQFHFNMTVYESMRAIFVSRSRELVQR